MPVNLTRLSDIGAGSQLIQLFAGEDYVFKGINRDQENMSAWLLNFFLVKPDGTLAASMTQDSMTFSTTNVTGDTLSGTIGNASTAPLAPDTEYTWECSRSGSGNRKVLGWGTATVLAPPYTLP
jgi:hypothetical protein